MRAREFAAALSAWPQCQWRPIIRSKKAYTTVQRGLYNGSKRGLYYGQKRPILRSKVVVAELLNSRCPGTFPRQNAGPLTDALVSFWRVEMSLQDFSVTFQPLQPLQQMTPSPFPFPLPCLSMSCPTPKKKKAMVGDTGCLHPARQRCFGTHVLLPA